MAPRSRRSATTLRSPAVVAMTSRSAARTRRVGSIRRTSTPRTTMRATSTSSRASHYLAAAARTTRTSLSSTVTARSRFPTTYNSANRPIPTITKRKRTRSLPCSFVTPSATPAQSPTARPSNRREFKISAIRITTSSTANRSTSRRPRTATAAHRPTVPTRSRSVRRTRRLSRRCAPTHWPINAQRSITSCRPTTHRTSASIRSRRAAPTISRRF